MDSEEKLKIVWIEMGEHCIMKCKKCGKEIICTGLKVPRKCDECGTEFKMNIHNKDSQDKFKNIQTGDELFTPNGNTI